MTTPRECCSPRHGIFVSGLCVTCGRPEEYPANAPSMALGASEGSDHIRGRWDRPTPVASDAVAHYDRTDPGQSLSGECTHSFFRVGRCALGRFRCAHCGLVLIAADP